MKLYNTNIRGIKSKKHSLEIYLKEYEPDLVGIVETHLEETEDLEIEGYEMWRNKRVMDKDRGKAQICNRLHASRQGRSK